MTTPKGKEEREATSLQKAQTTSSAEVDRNSEGPITGKSRNSNPLNYSGSWSPEQAITAWAMCFLARDPTEEELAEAAQYFSGAHLNQKDQG
jgi:hypothetical protein